MKKSRYLLFPVLITALLVTVGLYQAGTAAAKKEGPTLKYEIKAENARLIRQVTGPVTAYVAGVPAIPVDSFLWDGVGIESIEGSVKVEIDPIANTGEIKANWVDNNGSWTYKQTVFAPPGHSSGLQVGPGAGDTNLIDRDPVTTNVYLHGDTTAGGPVLPVVFNYLATWGPAEITLNGQLFENPGSGPAPLWVGHTMTTVGVRNELGEVRSDVGIFSMFNMYDRANGITYNDQLEFHLVFHDAMGPMTDNIPPPHAFFYHVTFKDVKMEIEGME